MKKLFTLFICGMLSIAAFADGPFRNHRFDAFKILSPAEGSILFIGNSITDMHCWPEAFKTSDGKYLPIVNRGNSGTYSTEQSDNIESYLRNNPKKVFMMIGTNDIATSGGLNFSGEQVLQYIKSIVERIWMHSPDTKIYLYSILKNKTYNRVEATWLHTNDLIKNYVSSKGSANLKYIDLYDKLAGVADGGEWSYDNLHLTAAAYKVWCETICEHLAEDESYTVSTVYPEETSSKQNNGGFGRTTHGMRATYFSMLPISNEDVLVFGDEFIKNGEWQELLGSYNVKNRGTGWGYGGSISVTSNIVEATYADTGVEKKDAKAIFIYTGTEDCNGETDIETVKNNYKALIDKVAEKSPTSKIYLMGLCPTDKADKNTKRIKSLNDYLATLANDKIRYVDTYTPLLSDNVANEKYFYPDNYLGGIGYAVVANKMKEALLKDFPEDKYNVISEEEAVKRYEQATLRNNISKIVARGMVAERGTSIGMYDNEKMKEFDTELNNVKSLFAKEEITEEEANTTIAKLNDILGNALTMPKASTAEAEYWYQFTSLRSSDRYITAKGEATGVVGEQNVATSPATMWKFVKRDDNSFDIINNKYNTYLNPVATYNTQIETTATKPAKGWTINRADTPAYYIISSGDVQLNQTGSGQSFKLYNWSNNATLGNDRSDTGCQLKILEADPEKIPEIPEVEIPDAVVSLDETVLDGAIPYELTADEAEKVFALESYTITMDITLNSSISGRGAFVCAADPAQPTTSTATPTSTPYFALGHYNGELAHLASTRASDRFTASGATLTAGSNVKIAYVLNRTAKGSGKLEFYINGTKATKEFTYPLVGYEAPAFCDIKSNHPSASIFIGAGMANNAAIEQGDGTINSVDFYNTVLTAEQIAAIANKGVQEPVYEEITVSTEGDEHWYYITSAATKSDCAYCTGKVMYYDNEMQKIRFGEKRFAAEYIWSFWKQDGKLAIKNYNGEYFGTPGEGSGNNTAFGVVETPNYIYTVEEKYDAFIIKDTGIELHAQNDDKVIVRWGSDAGNASLWKFETVDVSDANVSLGSTTVEQGKISTGIGNTNQPIVRSTINVNGLEGTLTFQGVTGEFVGTNKNDITNVKAYFATNSRELFVDTEKKMSWREENGEQFGEPVTLNDDGTFTITGSKELKSGANYLWITYDIAENAKEGNKVDVNITGYNIDGKEVKERRGNPQYEVTIFLSEGAVLMPMDKGSMYYRIPAITVTKDGKRLVTLTDDRKQHNRDLPSHCYLVAQYSEDNGRTWSDPVTVAGTAETGGEYGHGDASIVTNRDNGDIVGIMTSAGTYGHGFFAGTAAEPPRWKTITSHDGGLTWEAPVDHTNDLFGANCSNPNTKTWKSGFSGSGAALQKRDGTLVSSFVNRQADDSQHFYFFMSKDGGKSWYVSGTSGTDGADEPKTLERNNGDLAISVRSSGYNYYNYTSDDGATWHNPWRTRFTTGISGNACDGEYMVWCSTVEGNPWDIALQTLPNNGGRENVSIALSTDEGATFGSPKTICPRGSAYSAAVVLPDGTLGVYYEENGIFGGYTMRFVRFSLDWASDGEYKFTEAAPFHPIKSTNPTAIEEVKDENENVKTIYDLFGRKVEKPTNGIYIVNGKKVLIKE